MSYLRRPRGNVYRPTFNINLITCTCKIESESVQTRTLLPESQIAYSLETDDAKRLEFCLRLFPRRMRRNHLSLSLLFMVVIEC